jgi:hypothetical protein
MLDQKPTLTEKQVSRFSHDGFLKIPQLVDLGQVHMLKTRVQELGRGEGDDRITRQVEPDIEESGDAAPPRKFHQVAAYDAIFQEYLQSDPVRKKLATFLGPDFLVYSDIVFMKPARVGSRQPYHQDRVLGYHIDDQAGMVGLWLALDRADEENGCLRFLPGSQKNRLTRHPSQQPGPACQRAQPQQPQPLGLLGILRFLRCTLHGRRKRKAPVLCRTGITQTRPHLK